MFQVLLLCSVFGTGEFTTEQTTYLRSLAPGVMRYRTADGSIEKEIPVLGSTAAAVPYGASVLEVHAESAMFPHNGKTLTITSENIRPTRFHVVNGNNRTWLLNEQEWAELRWIPHKAEFLFWNIALLLTLILSPVITSIGCMLCEIYEMNRLAKKWGF